MTTALTVYYVNNTATSQSASGLLANSIGGTGGLGHLTLLGTATGFGEICYPAQAGAWAAAGSIGAPSGKGGLWDVTTLEGQEILAGNWHPLITLFLSAAGSITADLYVRLYKWISGPTYTPIGTCQLLAQTITSTHVQYDFGNTSLGAVSFATGEKLYTDLWANVTANANANSSLDITIQSSNSATQGRAAIHEIITPGYLPYTTSTRTITATAALQATSTRTITATASLVNARVIPADAALQATSTRTIPATAALQATSTRTIPADAALSAIRIITADAALSLTSTRTIPASAALQATSTRTISVDAALSLTSSRSIPADSALELTSTRTIPATADLVSLGLTRTIPATAALVNARVIPATAAVLETRSRIVPCDAALWAADPVSNWRDTMWAFTGVHP